MTPALKLNNPENMQGVELPPCTEHENTGSPIELILPKLDKLKKTTNGYMALCPAHEDKKPSLSIKEKADKKVSIKCYVGCSSESILFSLGLSLKNLYPRKAALTLRELSVNKGFSEVFLKELRVYQIDSGVCIPYFAENGTPAPKYRIRRAISGNKGSIWNKGIGAVIPYGLWKLEEAKEKNYLIFVEGESDCWTLWFHEYPTLGIPGATMTGKIVGDHIKGIPKIYVIQEPDQGGTTFVSGLEKQLKKLRWQGEFLVVKMPEGIKDANELHLKYQEEFKGLFQSCLEKAEVRKIEKETKSKNSTKSPYYIDEEGVWYKSFSDDCDDEPEKIWICSPLWITARTRDAQNNQWGRLLEFKDPDGNLHKWAIPMKLFGGDGNEFRSELLSQGLQLSPSRKARIHLTNYIQTTTPENSARCVDKTGWFKKAFVLPEETIGEAGEEEVLLQTTSGDFSAYSQSGTLEEWQENVAKLCQGNSRLVFSLSCAFASTLLNFTGDESGGFHFRGHSSIGKTTALFAACSVWGNNKFLQNWRSTTNGLEAVATLRNDSILLLDELAQVDPKEAGEIAYMLANGSGKQRASRNGRAREKTTWRLLFLSSGEIGLTEHMRQGGKKARAGQEVRIVDIPADTETGNGLFETLYHFENGASLSIALKENCQNYYGVASREFLERLTKGTDNLALMIDKLRKDLLKEILPSNSSGQVHRVAQRFALVAAGGELATSLGITNWEKGEAIEAIKRCFCSWLEARGSTDLQEVGGVLSQIKHFFEKHGESRFTPWNKDAKESKTINRAGFRKEVGENQSEFFVLTNIFRNEICEGYDCKFVSKILIEKEWLKTDPSGKATRSERLPGLGNTRCYVFTSKVFEED